MSIKTWQERAHLEPDVRVEDLAYGVDLVMQIEIDELRAALVKRDAEIEQLTETSLWQAGRISELLDEIAAQRKVLEQALEALNDITAEINMKRFWREKDEKRFDEIADEAITAIQEQLA